MQQSSHTAGNEQQYSHTAGNVHMYSHTAARQSQERATVQPDSSKTAKPDSRNERQYSHTAGNEQHIDQTAGTQIQVSQLARTCQILTSRPARNRQIWPDPDLPGTVRNRQNRPVRTVYYRPLYRTFHFSNDRPSGGPILRNPCTTPHETVFFCPTNGNRHVFL